MTKEKSFLRFAESEREKNATNKYGWESENFKIERWQRQTAADTKTHTQHGTKHNKNPQASITIFHTWTRKKTAAAKNNNIENCMSEWYAWYITVLLDYNVQLQSLYTKQWTLYVYLCIVRPQKKPFHICILLMNYCRMWLFLCCFLLLLFIIFVFSSIFRRNERE